MAPLPVHDWPPSLLGTLYEQMLGLPLHRDAQNRVHHQQDRSASRTHGVTYTPTAVARYMVEHTVGAVLRRNPIDASWADPSVSPLRIIDPACGAGVFLLAAFDHLQAAYLAHADRFHPAARARLFVWSDQRAHPTRTLNEHIVRHHLFGMDRDDAALQVARHTLSLRVAADIPKSTAAAQCSALHDNLLCCDTLLPSDAHTARFISDGFQVCIGNPPYVFGEWIDAHALAKYAEHLSLAGSGQPDLFKLFYERSIRDLLRPDGLHAFVVPDALLARDDHRNLRSWLTHHLDMLRICHPGRVFERISLDAAGRMKSPQLLGVSSVITIGQRTSASTQAQPVVVIDEWRHGEACQGHTLAQSAITTTDGAPWAVHAPPGWFGHRGLRQTMRSAGSTLAGLLKEGVCGITRGEERGKRSLAVADGCPVGTQTPVLVGSDIRRHHCGPASRLAQPGTIAKRPALYAGPKILVVKTGAAVVAATSLDDTPVLQSIYCLHLSEPAQACWDEDAVVGVLCSAWVTAWTWYSWTSGKKQQPQLTLGNVKAIPLPADPDAAKLRTISKAVQTLCTQLTDPCSDAETQQRILQQTEWALDTAVGELYGLQLDRWLDVLRPALSRLPRSQRPRWFDPSGKDA